MCRPMVSRTVSLEASAYERLRAAKRPGESFSQTVLRILEPSRPSFRMLAGALTRSDAAKVSKAIADMRVLEALAERGRFPPRRSGPRGRHG
jgi:predicted CopG family antitoxin